MDLTYTEMAREILQDDYPEWEVEDSSLLICPHGHKVEYDGRCEEGCESPFLKLGMI